MNWRQTIRWLDLLRGLPVTVREKVVGQQLERLASVARVVEVGLDQKFIRFGGLCQVLQARQHGRRRSGLLHR